VALLVAALVLVGAMHVARDRVAPSASVTVVAGP
jgi:hypothetical protein